MYVSTGLNCRTPRSCGRIGELTAICVGKKIFAVKKCQTGEIRCRCMCLSVQKDARTDGQTELETKERFPAGGSQVTYQNPVNVLRTKK